MSHDSTVSGTGKSAWHGVAKRGQRGQRARALACSVHRRASLVIGVHAKISPRMPTAFISQTITVIARSSIIVCTKLLINIGNKSEISIFNLSFAQRISLVVLSLISSLKLLPQVENFHYHRSLVLAIGK
jgi:hypothetical protein